MDVLRCSAMELDVYLVTYLTIFKRFTASRSGIIISPDGTDGRTDGRLNKYMMHTAAYNCEAALELEP